MPAFASAVLVGGVAVAAGVPSDGAPASTELERTNEALRDQLQRERARTTRIVRAERRRAARTIATYRRQINRSPSVRHALSVAAATYGVPASRLTRVAHCESTLDPNAGNGPYQGLFQFGSTLWSRTPYRDFPRTDPYASALAASWAFSRGMAPHWPVCGYR